MVDRSELRLGQHVVVRLCGGETVGAVVDGLCNDWVGVRPDRGGYVIADWDDIEVEVDAEEVVRTEQGEVLAEKKARPELVQQPTITYTYNSNASRDERLKAALLALLNSDLLKVKEGGYFTKQDLIEWVERIPTDKPATSPNGVLNI